MPGQRFPLLGFTIIELVVVIVLMGVLSVGTVSFISDSSNGYASTMRRTELASNARLAIERISRDLRDVLPNSTRINTDGCIEFVPVAAASTFIVLPVVTQAGGFKAVPLESGYSGATDRVAVYPDTPLATYTLTGDSVVSPIATISAPDGNNQITVSFAAAHKFPAESPGKRFFLVEPPVSYCLSAGSLWRYSAYGFSSVQPELFDLPTTMPGRVLLGENVGSDTAAFMLSDATLLRNAVVTLDLNFAKDGDTIRINHQVQLRNVP